jgi:DNA-binding SARP family transcriptional activator
MRLHYLNGDRAAALRLYEQCAVALDEELGVKVSKRTKSLYKQILADQQVTPISTLLLPEAQPMLDRSTPSLSEALDYLTGLQEFLTDLQSQVQQSLQQVERALNKNPAPFSSPKIDAGNEAPETLRRRY